MADFLQNLPRQDRRLVELMAAEADTTATAMAAQMVREYLGLVRSAPDALPNNPMRRLTADKMRRGV